MARDWPSLGILLPGRGWPLGHTILLPDIARDTLMSGDHDDCSILHHSLCALKLHHSQERHRFHYDGIMMEFFIVNFEGLCMGKSAIERG